MAILSINDGYSEQSVDVVVLSFAITVDLSYLYQYSNVPALVQSFELAPLNAIHIHRSDSISMVPSVNASVHIHLADDPYGLGSSSAYHDQLSSGALSVVLIPNDSYISQFSDDIWGLLPDNSVHSQYSDAIGLIKVLNPENSSAIQYSDVVVLRNDATPDNSVIQHYTESPLLLQSQNLLINNSFIFHNSDLTIVRLLMNVVNTIHYHDTPTISVGPSVAASSHLHFADDPYGVYTSGTYHEQAVDAILNIPLLPDNSYNFHFSDNIWGLHPDNTIHYNITNNVDIVKVLNPDSTYHNHSSDVVVYKISYFILLGNDYISHISDNINVISEGIDSKSSYHNHTADNILSMDENPLFLDVNTTIIIQNSEHIIGALGPYLLINNSLLRHYIDNVSLIYDNPILSVNDGITNNSTYNINGLNEEVLPSVSSVIEFPVFDVKFGFGISGSILLPSFGVDGDITISSIISGDITFPSFGISSSVLIGQELSGNIIIPMVTVDSNVNVGIGIGSVIEFPVFSINSEIYHNPVILGEVYIGVFSIKCDIIVDADYNDYLLVNKKGGSDWEPFV